MPWIEPKTWSAELVLAADDLYRDRWVRGRINLPNGLESLSVGDLARLMLPNEDLLFEVSRAEPYTDIKLTVGEIAFLLGRNPEALAFYDFENSYKPHFEYLMEDIRGVNAEPYSSFAWAVMFYHLVKNPLPIVEGEMAEFSNRGITFDMALPYLLNDVLSPAVIAHAVEYDIDPTLAKFLPAPSDL